MVSTCCVPNCSAFQLENQTLKFHKFPKSPILKQRWIEAIFKDTDFEPLNSSLVCEKHFRQFDYIQSINSTKVLSGLAIPSMFWEKNTTKERNGNCDVAIPKFKNLISIEDEMITKYNFQEVCRCCVSNRGEVNVFEVQSHNIFFTDLIYFCTNEKILPCDGLPNLICQVCKEQICKFFEFIDEVKINQAYIRKFSQLFSLKFQEQSEEINFRKNSHSYNIALTEKNISSESRAGIVLFKQKYKGLTKVYKQLCDILLQNKSQIKRHTKMKHKENGILSKDSVKTKIIQNGEIISILPVKQEKDTEIELSTVNENNNSASLNSDGEKILHNNLGIYNVPGNEDKINEYEFVQIDSDDIESPKCDNDIQKNNNDKFTIKVICENEKVKSSTQCIDCSEVFNTEAGIIRHCRSTGHSMTYQFKCELCSSTFRLRRYYKMHLQRHNESKCICEICGAIIFSNNLRRHMDIHTDRRIHICQICGKTYARKGILDIHIKNQHSGKDNKSLCFICGKSFRTLSLLNSHLNHKHVEDDLANKSYQCEMCKRFFISKVSLKFHKKFSHEENPIQRFRCNKRNKVISTDQSLIIKQQKHKYCTFCLKYVKSSEYKMHMLVHKNMKPLQCKICNKQFAQVCRLKLHMKMHQNALVSKLYKCKYCLKSFTQKQALITHIRLHKG